MLKKNNIDIIIILMSLVIGVFLGYMIGKKISSGDENIPVVKGSELEYVYILQIAKFDNPSGAKNYQNVLSEKNLDSIVVYDKIYYYIYGGIASSEEKLSDLKNKFSILGYNPIIKKELLIEKTNSCLDNEKLYSFYSECINNLYKSLLDEDFEISEKYNVDPVNIELFTQMTIIKSMKNESLRRKAQMQAYKIIIESL